MSEPNDLPDEGGLRPAWRRDRRAVDLTPAPAPEEQPAPTAAEPAVPVDEDLERGRTLALLAALGRIQLSLDVLARQQQRQADDVDERLSRIERRLGGSDG
jgi:hypothetical protein